MDSTSIAKLVVATILTAARDAGPMGFPSGYAYAALMQYGITLDIYQTALNSLINLGLVTLKHDCIFPA